MSGYLLDTNAISILAPPAATQVAVPSTVARFRTFVREHDDELFLSTITLAEIQAGISQLQRKGSTRRAAALAHWLNAILELYDARTLPLTSFAALETGRLLDRAIAAGADPGFEDAAIAATAAVHDLTVVTANVRHFQHFGVPFRSPIEAT
jgi:predicted nucleic acid-binding protein